jgi:hypothetical protein
MAATYGRGSPKANVSVGGKCPHLPPFLTPELFAPSPKYVIDSPNSGHYLIFKSPRRSKEAPKSKFEQTNPFRCKPMTPMQ